MLEMGLHGGRSPLPVPGFDEIDNAAMIRLRAGRIVTAFVSGEDEVTARNQFTQETRQNLICRRLGDNDMEFAREVQDTFVVTGL